MLGLLDSMGVVTLVNAQDKIFLEKNQLVVQLTGQPFHYDIDRRDRKIDYCIKKDAKANFAIHMVHGMLLKKPFFEGIPYTLIDDILETEADLTFSGHYHSGYGLIELNQRYFLNPGSLVRINNSISELTRQPQVVIAQFSLEGINFEFVKLKSALPGEEVLDREELCRRDYREKKLIDFTQGIKSVGDIKSLNINEIIEKIANESKLSRPVVIEAIKRISAAQENLFQED